MAADRGGISPGWCWPRLCRATGRGKAEEPPIGSAAAVLDVTDLVDSGAFTERVLALRPVHSRCSASTSAISSLFTQRSRRGALTVRQLAAATHTGERYVREWLEQQVLTVLLVGDAGRPADLRRFSLPAEHAEVLANADSLEYLAPLAQMLTGAATPIDQVLEAYRTGSGVPMTRSAISSARARVASTDRCF